MSTLFSRLCSLFKTLRKLWKTPQGFGCAGFPPLMRGRGMGTFSGEKSAENNVAYAPRRAATTRAAFTPEAPACARPRVTPAPSPQAKKPGRAVSSSWESRMRAE